MKWINAKEELPPRCDECDDTSIEVLVCVFAYRNKNNADWGHGYYDYEEQYWTYTTIGHNEANDNKVLFWSFPPELPSLTCSHIGQFSHAKNGLWKCGTCGILMSQQEMESL